MKSYHDVWEGKAETRCMMCNESLHSIFVTDCSDSVHLRATFYLAYRVVLRHKFSSRLLRLCNSAFRHCGKRRCVVGCVITDVSTVRGGADKTLAGPTSRCRRKESIVSLERGVCSCAELQAFYVTEAERKYVRRRALFQHREASCQVFFLCKAGRQRKFTAF